MSQTLIQFDYSALGDEGDSTRVIAIRIKGLCKKSAEQVIEIGRLLLKVKANLPHGKFCEWTKYEFGWDRKSVYNFMNAASKFGEIEMGKISPFDQSSLYLLSAPSTPNTALDEAMLRAEAGEPITHAVAKEIVQRHQNPRISIAIESLEEFEHNDGPAVRATSLDHLSGLKFGTIYADPPWQYGNQSTRAATDDHYGTMTVKELCEMPIEQFAADDAHLHLWTTNGFLREAYDVMDAWGFEYRSCFVWCKPQMGIGNYWRVSHEFLLLGIRGDAKRFNDHGLKSWAEFDRGRHSAKPYEVRRMVERASPGPYLELFGREIVGGWTVFGNQVDDSKLFA